MSLAAESAAPEAIRQRVSRYEAFKAVMAATFLGAWAFIALRDVVAVRSAESTFLLLRTSGFLSLALCYIVAAGMLPMIAAVAATHTRPRLTRTFIPFIGAWSIAVVFAAVGLSLTQGTWIGTLIWIPVIRAGVVVLAVCVAWVPGRALFFAMPHGEVPGAASTRRSRVMVAFACLVVGIAATIADAIVLPRHYPGAHGGLVFLAMLAAGLAASTLLAPAFLSAKRRLPVSFLLFALVLSAAIGVDTSPDDDADREQRDFFDRAPFASRIAGRTIGSGRRVERSGAISFQIRASPQVDPKELDLAFADRRLANVVIVTIDTVRADHVGCYGYPRSTTPVLDALARESIVFDAAYAQHPSSQLSMASWLRGLQPTATDVWQLGLDTSDPTKLRDTVLPEVFRARGRETIGVTTLPEHFYATQMPYVSRGFDRFENLPLGDAASGRSATDKALEGLNSIGDRPWFLWVHYFNPHEPYSKHEDFDFGDGDMDVYDSEIASADRETGRLLEALRGRADWARTVVVIHSDHGEEFGERGGRAHHSSLYDEQVRVPFLMRIPGIASRRISKPVGLVDLLPTLAELCDLPQPDRTDGRSLLWWLFADDADADRRAPSVAMMFRDSRFASGRLDAVRVGDEKLIRHGGSGRCEVYDLAKDPAERHDLATSDPDRREWLERYLRTMLSGTQVPDDAAFRVRRIYESLTASPPNEIAAVADITALAADGRYASIDSVRFDRTRLSGKMPRVDRALLTAMTESRWKRFAEFARSRVLDDDIAVRRAALWALAVLDPKASPAEFARVAPEDDGASGAAVIAASWRGDPAAVARLAEIRPRLEGLDILRADATLAAKGDADARRRTAATIFWDVLPPDILLPYLERMQGDVDADLFCALYLRWRQSSRSKPERRLDRALLDSLGVDDAASFLRSDSDHPDAERRRDVELRLESAGRKESLETMRQANRNIMLAEQYARGLGDFVRARDLSFGAFEAGVAAGYFDAGALVEAYQYILALNEQDRASVRFGGIDTSTSFVGTRSRAVMQRMVRLLATLDRRPEVTFALRRAEGRASMEEPFVVDALIGVDPTLGGVPGGLPHWAPCIAVRGRQSTASESGDRLFPLPPLGLLPGESFTATLCIDDDGRSSAVREYECAFFFRDHFLHGPRPLRVNVDR